MPGQRSRSQNAIPVYLADDDLNPVASGSASDPTTTNARETPTADASAGIVPVRSANGFDVLAKAAPGNLYSATLTAAATAGFLITLNRATALTAGAAITQTQIMHAIPVAANSFATVGGGVPDRHTAGIFVLFSTSTTTYTQPANAALNLRARVV